VVIPLPSKPTFHDVLGTSRHRRKQAHEIHALENLGPLVLEM